MIAAGGIHNLADAQAFLQAGAVAVQVDTLLFIDPRSAITIGMLPDLPLECYRTLGNSSLEGAKTVLQQPQSLERIDRIRDRITYMELNVNQAFMNRFSAAKFLPHTNPGLFPSVATPSTSRAAGV
jgi:uncharacterized 2Fe-2S/4Fe-4S cluster protein (DUF4445 family)